MGFFILRNLVLDAQREADIVPAVQQALAAEGIDAELEVQPGVVGNGLCLQDRPSAGSLPWLRRGGRFRQSASSGRVTGRMPFLKQLL